MWGVGAPKIGERDNEDGTISKIGDDQNGGDNPRDDPSSSRRLGNKWGGARGKTTVVYGTGIIISAAAPVWVAGAMIVRWTSQEKGN